MDRSSKRPDACSSSWAQKKKHSRDTPVSEFKEVNFSQITESMKEWDILFLCCDTLLKDSPDGRYKILIVCCMDVSCSFFKLTAMGSKGEEYFGLLEVQFKEIVLFFCCCNDRSYYLDWEKLHVEKWCGC